MANKVIQYRGEHYTFPEDATEQEITAALPKPSGAAAHMAESPAREEMAAAINREREAKPQIEAAKAAAIPLGGMLAGATRLPMAAATGRTAVAGGIQAAQANPEDRMRAFLQGAGVNALIESVMGAGPAVLSKIPGVNKIAKITGMLGKGGESPQPMLHQKATPIESGGGSAFDTATGKSMDIPRTVQPITFQGQAGPVTVQPPTGGSLSDVILQEPARRAAPAAAPGQVAPLRTIADILASRMQERR